MKQAFSTYDVSIALTKSDSMSRRVWRYQRGNGNP